MEAITPCPFCGGTKVSVSEGSTFRWRYAGCAECGAQAGEIRCQTMGEGNPEKWEAQAKINAMKAWNERSDTQLESYRSLIVTLENEIARLKEGKA